MRGYVTKRLLIAVVTLFGMSIVIFSLMRLAPGNIVDILFESAGYVDQADKKQLERELGVDRPLAVQYARWVGEVARGDLGKSYRYDMPAWRIIKPRLPVTLELAFLALFFSILLGVPFGVLSAGLPAIVISARTCPSPGVSISSARQAAGSSPYTSGAWRTRLVRRPKRTPLPRPGVPRVLALPLAAFVNMAPPTWSRCPASTLTTSTSQLASVPNSCVQVPMRA